MGFEPTATGLKARRST